MVYTKVIRVLIFICLNHLISSGLNCTSYQNITATDAKYHVAISLIFKDAAGRAIRCGGCIINPKTVLTAAHCLFFNMNNASPKARSAGISVQVTFPLPAVLFEVTAGTTNQHYVRGDGSIEFGVVSYIYHNSFNLKTSDNDIALLRLDGEAPRNHPNVVPLPIEKKTVPRGTECFMFGYDSANGLENMSPTLLRIPITVFDITDCEGPSPRTSICAGDASSKTGSCKGDIGSPLICNNKVVGIKIPTKCGDSPAIFMDISKYTNWIAGNTQINTRQYLRSRASQLYRNRFYFFVSLVFISIQNKYSLLEI